MEAKAENSGVSKTKIASSGVIAVSHATKLFPNATAGRLRTEHEQVIQIVKLLCEGLGVRATFLDRTVRNANRAGII